MINGFKIANMQNYINWQMDIYLNHHMEMLKLKRNFFTFNNGWMEWVRIQF